MLKIESEQEEDGRWIAEVTDLPGVLAYGRTRDEANARAQALALRVIADRLEHGEALPCEMTVSYAALDCKIGSQFGSTVLLINSARSS